MDARYKTHSPLQRYLESLHDKYLGLDEGKVADYIPELSHADPDWFGIALVTVDGHVYQVGDTHEEFTIQSISKAITYGLALAEHGIDHVTGKVGVEPSGDAFNSISLDPETGQPCNPMINAGAIATTGIIYDRDGLQRMLDSMERYVGHTVCINESVYRSESDTGHRNRAIAHLLRNFNIIEDNPDDVLELYFKQCSMNVNCRDLAVMAACLANNGVNPITGVVALENRYVNKVLSVMGSCGMYDYSGNWLYRIGMPAKSGVGGGIIAVLPGQFGLAVFSPLLDDLGNSVRGIRVCEELSAEFGLHLFSTSRSTSASVLRVKYSAAQVSSCKSRREPELKLLEEHGNTIRGYELQGDLMFSSTEHVIIEMMDESDNCDYFIVDLKRVVGVDEASARLWLETVHSLQAMGKHLFFTNSDDKYAFVRYLKIQTGKDVCDELFRFRDRDHALEWCEDRLLEDLTQSCEEKTSIGLEGQALCQGLTEKELDAIKGACKEIRFKAGDIAFRRGDVADSMYFIEQGILEVIVQIDSKREKRLTTISAGMSFGELAILNRNTRAAEVRAKKDTLCYELKFADIASTIHTKFLVNLAGILASKIERDAREIAAMY